MAWLTTHNATNKVPTGLRKWTEERTLFTPARTNYERTVEEEQYNYVGMTYAAAETCLDAMNAAGYDAMLSTENNGGGYMVSVTQGTIGEWSEV